MEEGIGGEVVEGRVGKDCQEGGEKEGRTESEERKRPSGEVREEVNARWKEEGRECDAVEDPKGDQATEDR